MPKRKLSIAGLSIVVGLVLLALIILAPLLYYPFARDHGMYMVVAETMARGGMPYADAWDLKPPGIFFVFRTALGLFGRNMWGVRVLELVFLAATALALGRLGRRLAPGSPAGAIGAAWFLLFLGHNLNYWHTAQAESFLLLPLVLGLDLSLKAMTETPPRAAAAAALSGLCMGLVFIFKFPNILPFACVLPLAFSSSGGAGPDGRPRPSRHLPTLAWFAAGSLLPPALAAGWFAAGGAWTQMLDALFVFAPRYAVITASPGLLAHGFKVFSGFFLSMHGLFLLKWLALAGLVVCLGAKKSPGRFVLPLWLALSLAVIWVQGKFFLYHYLPLYLPVALLAGVAISRLAAVLAGRVRGTETAKRRVLYGLLSIGLVLPFLCDMGTLSNHWRNALAAHPVSPGGPGMEQYSDGTDFSLAADLEMAEYLRQNTGPGDTLFIWGYETLVYFLSDRVPASRFVSHQPLASRWQMPGWREELLTDLEARQPARILVLRNDAMPAVTGATRDSAGLLREFPELERFIARRYHVETEIEDFQVYSLVAAPPDGLSGAGDTDDEH
jgi:hypothetical protein